MNENKSLKIKFGGESSQINAKTFLNSLASFVSIVEEIDHELFHDNNIEVKINAIEPGSFVIDIELLATAYEALAPLINRENFYALSEIVAMIVGLYEIRKHLKGKKAKEIEKDKGSISIQNSEGEQKYVNSVVYNFYNTNLSVKEALNNTFEALSSDQSVKDFELIDDKEKTILKIDKEEFPELTNQDIEEDLLPDQQSIRVRTFISLFKIVFDKKYVWEFIYKGNRINAKINDDSFFKNIDSGEKFAKGDVLEVELEILQEFDPSVDTYVNRKYEINKVHEHIPRGEQRSLEF